MKINDKFIDGENQGLTLREVYQGTQIINNNILDNFLFYSSESEIVPKPEEFLLCELRFNKGEIEIIPDIFDENKLYSHENLIHFGDISNKLEIYFNHFFNPNWYGVIKSFQSFNHGKYVIGGNPDYIAWCINKKNDFNIDLNTIRELEKLTVYRLKGIKVQYISINKYKYSPIINQELYSFQFNLKKNHAGKAVDISECEFPF